MSSTDFLLLSGTILGLALVLAAATWKPPKEKKESAPKETTRWKRFRVKPARFHGDLVESKSAVVEEPKGMKLLALPRAGSRAASRVTLATADKKTRVEVTRRWQPFRWRFHATLGKQHLFDLLVPKNAPGKHQLRYPSPSDAHELRGSVCQREYEILKQGRLVASVSWQQEPEDEEPPKEYVVEVLKGEDTLPVLALALTVEVALG